MIGKLKGIVDDYGDDHVIVDVGGVGYLVVCSQRTLAALPKKGDAATLFVETHVREDMIRLYGFARAAEREWFRLLTTVQGVGAKVALAILSTLDASDLAQAIALQDKAQIGRAPGVGPKLAQRIAGELRDKAPALASVDPLAARLAGDAGGREAQGPARDAISALVNLGYAQPQASAAVAAALRGAGEAATTETLIRLGLKEMAR
jgi:Holliday junction DNA helicase RuvA